MGAYLDMAAGNAGLKELYDGQKVENLAFNDKPFFAMVPKKTNCEGKYFPMPVIYGNSMGRSSTFATAQQNQTPMLVAEFLVPMKPDYSIATIARQLILASRDKDGSFIEYVSKFIDIAIDEAAKSAASSMFRSGTGSIGAILSIINGVIVLTNAADVEQFNVNQTLQASTTDGGSPLGALGYVIQRNVAAGTIIVSATALGGAAGTPTGWAASNFLLVQGDSNAKFTGLAGWSPATAPSSSDNFYGVNRSPDSRLYGLFYNGIQQPLEEAFIDAAMMNRRSGGKPKHIISNYGTISALVKALGARREYVDWEGKDGVVGFRGVKIEGPNGVIECYADPFCQAATAYLVQMDTWLLGSTDAVPHIFHYADDQSDVLRMGNADAAEFRSGYYANMGCYAPGWQSQIACGV